MGDVDRLAAFVEQLSSQHALALHVRINLLIHDADHRVRGSGNQRGFDVHANVLHVLQTDVGEIDAVCGDLLGQEDMCDLVEAALVVDGLAGAVHECGIDVHEGGDCVLVDDLAHYHRAFGGVYCVHGNDSHPGGVDIARAPSVVGAAIHEIPAQIVHGDNLGGNGGRSKLGPNYFPDVAFVLEVEVANILNRTDGCGPAHANAHLGVVGCGMKRAGLIGFERRERAQAAVRTGPLLNERWLVDTTGLR